MKQKIKNLLNVWVVTVNYKTAELLTNSLSSITSPSCEAVELSYVAVDNASQDGSVATISSYIKNSGYSNWASVIASDKNGGFSYGNNIGISKALSSEYPPDYVLLLNPDTLVKPNAINALADFLDKNSTVGIVGSQIENALGLPEHSAHRFPSLTSAFLEGASIGFLDKLFSRHITTMPLSRVPHQADWVSGSSMMVRREVFEQIGLLDDGFFLYFEEVDFFFRAKQAGWQTWYVPDSKIMHIEGASTGIKSNKRRPSYWYESRRRFYVKNYGILYLLLTDVLWLIGRLSFKLRCLLGLRKSKAEDPKWLVTDLLLGDIKSIFAGELFRIKQEKARFERK